MKVGAQLYTVRDFCKTLEGFEESLKKVADIGYKTVQVSGVCDFEPLWLKEKLEKYDLECAITHLDRDRIAKEPEIMVKEHEIYDCENIGIGWYSVHETSIEHFYNYYIQAAKIISSNNKRLCYHNHDHEFIKENGKTLLELMLNKFEPNELFVTLDTFWVQAAGGDVCDWILALKNRVPCLHLKDMGYGRKMLPVGEGNLNFEKIIKAASDSNTEFLIVEQDDSNGEDPFDCLRRSYKYLNSLGLN